MPGDAAGLQAVGAPLSPAAAATLLLGVLDRGLGAVLMARSPEEAETSTGPGPRLLLWAEPDLRSAGTLGDSHLDAQAGALAMDLLADRPGPGRLVALTTLQGLDTRVYVEVHAPPATLVIVGAGHIARPLAEVGALLGFQVTVLDDRPAFATQERFPSAASVQVMDLADPFADIPIHRGTHVVLVTRGHRYDYECLLKLLDAPVLPGYLGLIGSRRRIRATFEQLVREGIPRERIDAIRAPLGLDLGAQTPAEIAVAVAAELVMLHRGGTGTPLRDRERVLERFFPGDPP